MLIFKFYHSSNDGTSTKLDVFFLLLFLFLFIKEAGHWCSGLL